MKRLLTALIIVPATASISTNAWAQAVQTPDNIAYTDRTESVQNVQQSAFREPQLASNLDGIASVEPTEPSTINFNQVSKPLSLDSADDDDFESTPITDIGELLDVPSDEKSSGGIRFGL
ncbi:MAG: hypothetical protein F6K19_34775 [Cyanothece sp. SIO1E1]|nr:hypothetical protein [Cyanothece sp. SIO1E1]